MVICFLGALWCLGQMHITSAPLRARDPCHLPGQDGILLPGFCRCLVGADLRRRASDQVPKPYSSDSDWSMTSTRKSASSTVKHIGGLGGRKQVKGELPFHSILAENMQSEAAGNASHAPRTAVLKKVSLLTMPMFINAHAARATSI